MSGAVDAMLLLLDYSVLGVYAFVLKIYPQGEGAATAV